MSSFNNIDLSCLEEVEQAPGSCAVGAASDEIDENIEGRQIAADAKITSPSREAVDPALGTCGSGGPEQAEADNLRIILQVYHHQFKQDLAVIAKDLSSESLLMKGVAELKELRRKCDMLLGAASASQNKKKLFNSLIYIIEKLGTTSDALTAGVNLKGLTGAAIADKDFQKDLCRLSLKHLSAREVEPEVSAGMRLVSLIMQVNHNNTSQNQGVLAPNAQSAVRAPLRVNVTKANEIFKDL